MSALPSRPQPDPDDESVLPSLAAPWRPGEPAPRPIAPSEAIDHILDVIELLAARVDVLSERVTALEAEAARPCSLCRGSGCESETCRRAQP